MTSPQQHFGPLEAVFGDGEMAKFIQALSVRTSPKEPLLPPWSWPNLSLTEITQLDVALDQFVTSYNHVHAIELNEVIPGCWRRHPALAQELPVQFWAWYCSHTNPTATINQAVDYYSRTLPQFQERLRNRLLGKNATTCRKGEHSTVPDQELAGAISYTPIEHADTWGRGEPNRKTLQSIHFGGQAGLA